MFAPEGTPVVGHPTGTLSSGQGPIGSVGTTPDRFDTEPVRQGDRMPPEIIVRRVEPNEAEAAARVLIASRHGSSPAIPPPVHSDDEIVEWFRNHVMATQAVWVAAEGSTIVGVLVLSPGWIEHLYLRPERTGAGIGSRLLDRAKAESSGRLDLWTFVSNTGARRFYERHGFVIVDGTDGDNEEGEPDLRYRWTR